MNRSSRQRTLNLLGGLVFGWIVGAGSVSAEVDIAASPLFLPGGAPSNGCEALPGTVLSASSIATNGARFDRETLIYHAGFRSDDWSGQLLAYELAADGTTGPLRWDAAGMLPSHSSRNILTRVGPVPGSGGGAEFRWADLHPAQRSALNHDPAGTVDERGAERVAWLRGDASTESGNGGSFRSRRTALGDIVHSDPWFVGAPDFGYQALPIGTPGRTSYRTFVQSKLDADGNASKPMLYVGANDGMLHGFDADTGVERFAYVPGTLVSELNELMDVDYEHRYFVDGQSHVGDAFVDVGKGEQWASVLVGTTGAGGRTVFALDVTDPHSVGASNVLWEFTDPDLGATIGRPTVARMPDGTWAAVFGNGYNSDSHRAVLFIVRLDDGVLLEKIDTHVGSAGSPNGLATPSLLADGTRTIRTIFAGDLQGNLWAFDTGASMAGPNPVPLFTARDDRGDRQPITSAVEIGNDPQGGLMLYFGTGQYFETDDDVVGPNPQVQSLYGIRVARDQARPVTDRRVSLRAQRILWEGTPAGGPFAVRVTSDTPADGPRSGGWYLDLVSPLSGAAGERVVTSPRLRDGRLLVSTLIPSADPCAAGASWIMDLEATTGARPRDPVLDISGDGRIDGEDRVFVPAGAGPVPVSGARQGMAKAPASLAAGRHELRLIGNTAGSIDVLVAQGRPGLARVSWRQLQ